MAVPDKPASPPAAAARILCLKLASRGDLLLAAPAFSALRAARPDAWIVLLVGSSCEDVARRLPFFDEIAVIDDHSLFAGGRAARMRAALELLRTLRRAGKDATAGDGRPPVAAEVLIFHRDWRYGALAWLARIPVRRGIVDSGAGRFLTHPHLPGRSEHDVLQYLAMVGVPAERRDPPGGRTPGAAPPVSLAGMWGFRPRERDLALAAAAEYGFSSSVPNMRAVALGFGGGRNVKTRTELKKWPIEKYRELAERIGELGHVAVWLGDAEDAAELGGSAPGLTLAGRLTVPETAAVLSACAATVANDSLLLHLSEAVGTPTVGIFGPTDPLQYGPLGPRSSSLWIGDSMPCSPCHRNGHFPICTFEHRCMREIPVEAVLAKLLPLISSDGSPAGVERGVSRAG